VTAVPKNIMTRARAARAAALLLAAALGILGCENNEPAEVSVWSIYRGAEVGAESLRGLSATSHRDVWAVGARGTILHYDGLNWSKDNTGVTDTDLNAVAMRTADEGWAVGDAGLILRYAHGQWFDYADVSAYPLYDVALIGDANAFAVGEGGGLYYFDGTNWTNVAPAGFTADLRGVAVAPDETAWAVGDGGVILYYDGTLWRQVSSPTTARLNAVTVGPAGVYATGDYGVLLLNDGAGWEIMPTPTDRTLNSVGVSSAGVAFAVGNDGTLLRRKDDAWGQVAVDFDPLFPNNLNGIVMVNSTEGWAVGDNSLILRYEPAW
jgi:photosystem II stability/assembly factor-like uncharacterized protein